VTAVQVSRTATSSSVFTYAYILCVGVGLTAFILADYCWGIAAFRPDRDPRQSPRQPCPAQFGNITGAAPGACESDGSLRFVKPMTAIETSCTNSYLSCPSLDITRNII
jgi:hypothetical protein